MSNCDLSMIPNEVVRSVLRETVEKQLKSKKFNIIVGSASQAGENNFLGVVYRVSFNEDDESGSEKKTLKLILKVAPQNSAQRHQFTSRALFLREMYLYDVVFPMFREFEQSKGLSEGNGFNEYPKCYRTNDSDPNECVLLEDMGTREFSILDRYNEEVTADHVRIVMKTLGKLHAISIALKDQQPEQFQQLTSNLKETLLHKDDVFLRAFYNKQMENAFNAVSKEDDAHLLGKLKKLFEKEPFEVAIECLEVRTDSASVISHGDSWQNNIMFRYDNNGKPIEACILDWQISRHSSPVIDIVYFMFSCTTKALRDQHYDEFLSTYHESLSNHIRRLGSNPEELFSFNMFQDHLRKYAKFGLILAATVVLPIILADKGHVMDMDDFTHKMASGETSSAFSTSDSARDRLHERLRDVIVDMARLEYI